MAAGRARVVAGRSRVRERRRRRVRQRLAVLVLVLGAAGIVFWLVGAFQGPSSVRVLIGGRAERLPAGTTLVQAASRFALHAQAGNLLDVEGVPLERAVFPGRLLVNGRPRAPTDRLRAGDRVLVANGRDRLERRKLKIVRASLDAAADPQFFLDSVPGRYLLVTGAVSHKLVSVRFQPSGGRQRQRAVALTFDDGPFPPYTQEILAVLERFRVPATFFLIGRQVRLFPQLVRDEERAGMAIGDHTYNHPNRPAFARLPPARINSEIGAGQAALGLLGIQTQLFRPPGGSYSPYVVRAARLRGLRVALWSVDGRDWVYRTTAKQILRRVLPALRPGSIVILHDGGGDRSATVKALPALIKAIRARGLELVSLQPSPGTG